MKKNETYTGFVVDLMDRLKDNLGFTYEFKEVANHGTKQPDGKWTGGIGEILNDVSTD